MADRLILDGTEGTRVVASGNDFDVVGTGTAETIQVQDGGIASFTAGEGDRVDVQGNLVDFTVSSSGNVLTLTDAEGSTINVSLQTDTTIGFSDGSVSAGLASGDTGLEVQLGGQTADNTFDAATVTLDDTDASPLPADGNTPPPTVDTQAPTVDAGQTLTFTENAADGATLGTVTATDDTGVTGFSIVDDGEMGGADNYVDIAADGTVTLNAAGAADAAFNDFETTPNSFTVDVQAVDAAGNTSDAQSVAINVGNDTADDPMPGNGTVVDLDTLGGTVQMPASEDANGDAFDFTDALAAQSFTEITGFGADDELTFTGVTADDVTVSSSSGNTDISFDDGAGTVSSIQLTGVSGFFVDVASFNGADVGDITFA